MRRSVPHGRFLAFLAAIPGLALLLALVGSGTLYGRRDWPDLLMAGFCLASVLFLLSTLALMQRADAADMRRHAADHDAGRHLLPLLLLVLLLMVVLVVAWGMQAGRPRSVLHPLLPVASLVLAWLVGGVVMALHYAHRWWGNGDGPPPRGLDFPHGSAPTYPDFLYFSLNLSMTYQTSDVMIASAAMRRLVLAHCVAAFFFNISILALAFNLVASLVLEGAR